MRARNREVNIFNMSLLDILCGALGAFCFLMLVLFPYWKPKGATAEEIEKRNREMSREMDEIKKQLANSPDGAKVQEHMDRLNKQIQQQRQQLEQAQREAQRNKQEADQMRMRRPFTVTMVWSSPGHNLDLYVRYRGKGAQGNEQPMPDPAGVQGPLFGDSYSNCSAGPCAETWMVRDVPVGSEYEVYYKFREGNGNPAPANVDFVTLNGQDGFSYLPPVKIPQPRSVVMVGVVKLTDQMKLAFTPKPEYAEEFKRLNQPKPGQGSNKQPPQPQ